MKTHSANTNSVNDYTRCQHRTPSGRRCKLPVEAPDNLLCFTHTQELRKADVLNLRSALLTDYQEFQTAQGINSALSNLYKLLAANYISPRRAAVLAHINSLLLRTLPAIDADQAAGIGDPTAPNETETEIETELASSTTNVEEPSTTAANQEDTPAWSPSIPEPDPTKKPS